MANAKETVPVKKKASKASKAPKAAVSGYGAKLRRARKAKGLSQRQLAIKAYVTQSYICWLETGRIKVSPEAESRVAIKKILGV